MSRFVSHPTLFSLFLLLAGGHACAQSTFIHQAENPFDNNQDGLPDLGMTPTSNEGEKHFAEMMKAFGEASMTDNGLDAGEQAKQFAFEQVRDALSEQVNQQLETWLSPWGNASVNVQVDNEGNFNGSRGSWFIPWQDNTRYLTWSQLGLTQQDDGLVSNVGIGQRWARDGWLLGYNTFYDNLLDENLQRAGLGAEAWGEYLRLSANYYQPFASWQTHTDTLEQRMARGYDLSAEMRMPFYQHLNTRVSVEQYFGDSVDLFDSGTGYHNPVAVSLGLNYTPVPLVTVTAQHKQGESGVSQNNLGLNLNYRFGVPLKKQLSASEVAASQSLRGSRYDNPQRNNLPTMEYRQRKTLSAFLATPPWDLHAGETVALKLQVRSLHGVRHLTWQGDTQALSLTSGPDPDSIDGWTIIMPAWDNSEGATNRWRLSVVVEDEKGQRVSSNEITLALTEPFMAMPDGDPRWRLLPEE
ncbi:MULTISPECIES: YchO/YchP family invasin [Citrobacter]|uniref:YchO/YchP family invasin n=1 Tax=Citrobacter TaxID=544 RepID=UPI0015EAED25|nr:MULTISPECIES: YchO/YchP family invasin [unclassified Citrobacter]EHG7580247.1 YchO/YchP family invasin [Citrobacter sedlakii]EIQ7156483.1 YchO/YchP family invasin [Citrobacter sedlakii]QMK45902.1 YchO/YchP family invasin [Citrobacter sp. RHB21-C05]QMK64345.1 YchO/YchP family invasin [Citrobacter sp. RHB21-C01]HCJ6319936.1 YchO/YchP family invasin [Citrobacter sedlakii]